MSPKVPNHQSTRDRFPKCQGYPKVSEGRVKYRVYIDVLWATSAKGRKEKPETAPEPHPDDKKDDKSDLAREAPQLSQDKC